MMDPHRPEPAPRHLDSTKGACAPTRRRRRAASSTTSIAAALVLLMLSVLLHGTTAAGAAADAVATSKSSLRSRGGVSDHVKVRRVQVPPAPTRAPTMAATTPNPTTGAGGGGGGGSGPADDPPTLSPTLAPTPPLPTPAPAPTAAPTVMKTEAPTPLPTPPPPIYVTMVISIILNFPNGPGDVTWRNFNDKLAAQNAMKDALALAIIAIKRPDIHNITSVRGAGRLTELRLRVRLVTQLPSTGPHSDPSKYYDALRVQFRNADKDGSLNRYIQSSAVANGVDGLIQTELKSYTLPTSYMVNNVTVSVANPSVIPVDDGSSGVPTAIVISSILSAVLIFVGMALFTRQRLARFEIPPEESELTAALAPNASGGGSGAGADAAGAAGAAGR